MSKAIESAPSFKIWQAAIEAVKSETLVGAQLRVQSDSLWIAGRAIPLAEFDRLIVVGAGKAGAGMARGAAHELAPLRASKHLEGWINVPADCVEANDYFVIHPGRPAGVNEPTPDGVRGAQQIMDLVQSAKERDLVVGLISGGGSALLPLPVKELTLESKLQVTRFLSRSGATINELNCVRSAISQIKGGGLVRHFAGHSFHTLIISDVLGNPLDVIASGPTLERPFDPRQALEICQKFDPDRNQIDQSIFAYLETAVERPENQDGNVAQTRPVYHSIIGDNATAVLAAKQSAESMGFEVQTESASESEGDVESIAEHFWQLMVSRLKESSSPKPFCLVSGGEPTVTIRNQGGKGGRNQHLALLIAGRMMGGQLPRNQLQRVEFLSGGTDGEDGPTDAAGAIVNHRIVENAIQRGLNPQDFLNRYDAYRFFEQTAGLIHTGPTHTNVCDIRVLLIR